MRYIVTTICLIGLIGGCSSDGKLETATVTGKVLHQGKPLPYGSISFRPEAGPPAFGKIRKDGTYSLSTYGTEDGAIVGKHQVMIIATETDAGIAPANNSGIEMPVTKSVIPEQYASFSTSLLTAEVIPDKHNEFSFTLE